MPEPQRNRAFTCTVSLVATATGALLVNPPLAAGDFRVSKDGAAFANLTTLPVVAPAGSVCVQLALSAPEMDAARVVVHGLDPDGVWESVMIEIQTTVTLGGDARILLSTDSQPMLTTNTIQLAGNATSPVVLDRSVRTMVRGTVAAGGTVTQIPTSTLVPAAVSINQFKARVVIFDDATITTALRGQTCDITASTATGILTVTPLTTPPVAGDIFVIL
jgi:hypothetical protein